MKRRVSLRFRRCRRSVSSSSPWVRRQPEQVAPFISHEQILLREVDQKDLVVALKAAEEELKDKILGNMSERVRTFISEEMEFLGPMRLSEVEEVQLRIVQQVRQLEEQGQVTIVRGDADDSFV